MDVVKTILNKGLDQDHSPEEQPQGTYRYAENLINNSTEAINELASEPSIQSILDLAFDNRRDRILCGYVAIDSNRICLFLKELNDNYLNSIGIYTINTNELKIISGGRFNFSLYHPITGIYRKRNNNAELVYFTDGLNPPRVININKVYNDFSGLSLSLQKRVDIYPNLDVTVNEDFGLLLSGSYNVAIKLIDEDYQETAWLNISDIIYIYKDKSDTDNPSMFFQKSGNFNHNIGQNDSLCYKNIQVEISNLDTKYTFYKLALIEATEATGEVTKVKVTNKIHRDNTLYIFDNYLESFETIDISEIRTSPLYIKSAKTMTIVDNKLVLGNIKYEENDWDFLKDYASKITSECVPVLPTIHPLNESPQTEESGYRKTDISLYKENSRGYMPNELYAFTITYFFEDGTFSPAQHIPGETELNPAHISPDALAMQNNNKIQNKYLIGRDYYNYNNVQLNETEVRHHRFPGNQILGSTDYDRHPTKCWNLSVKTFAIDSNRDYINPNMTEGYAFWFAGLCWKTNTMKCAYDYGYISKIKIKHIAWSVSVFFIEEVVDSGNNTDGFNPDSIPQFLYSFYIYNDNSGGVGDTFTIKNNDNNANDGNTHGGTRLNLPLRMYKYWGVDIPVPDTEFNGLPDHFLSVRPGYKAKYLFAIKADHSLIYDREDSASITLDIPIRMGGTSKPVIGDTYNSNFHGTWIGNTQIPNYFNQQPIGATEYLNTVQELIIKDTPTANNNEKFIYTPFSVAKETTTLADGSIIPYSVNNYFSDQKDWKNLKGNWSYLAIRFRTDNTIYNGSRRINAYFSQRLLGIRFKNIILPEYPKKAIGYQIARAERTSSDSTIYQGVLQRLVRYKDFITYGATANLSPIYGDGYFDNRFYALILPEDTYNIEDHLIFDSIKIIGKYNHKKHEDSGIWINDVYPGSSYNDEIHGGEEDETGFAFYGRWYERIVNLEGIGNNSEIHKIKNLWKMSAVSQLHLQDVNIYNVANNQTIIIIELETPIQLPYFSDTTQHLLIECIKTNYLPYKNYDTIPYYKEHTNIQELDNILLFNGDVNETVMRRPNIIYWNTQIGHREKKTTLWRYIIAGIVGVVAIVASIFTGGAAAAAGYAAITAILAGTAVGAGITAAAIGIALSGIKLDEMYRIYMEEYDKGIRRTIQDLITKRFFNILDDSNNAAQIQDSNAVMPNPAEDKIIYYMSVVNNLSFMSKVKIGLSVKQDNISGNGVLRPTFMAETNRVGATGSYIPLNIGSNDFYGTTVVGGNRPSSASQYMLDKCLGVQLEKGEQQYKYRGLVLGDLTYLNLDYLRDNKETLFFMSTSENKQNKDLETRIVWSELSREEEITDYFRIFKANNYKDLQSTFGAILKLILVKQYLYVFCENTIIVLQQNQQERVQNDIVTLIGSGSYFERDGIQLLGEGNQLIMGSNFSFGSLDIGGRIFYLTEKNKSSFIIGTNNGNLSSNGLIKFFTDNLEFNTLTRYESKGKKYPLKDAIYHPLGNGIITGYDKNNNRLLVSKKDYKLDIDIENDYLLPIEPDVYYNGGSVFDLIRYENYEQLSYNYILEDKWLINYPNNSFQNLPTITDLSKSVKDLRYTPDILDTSSFTLSYSFFNNAWSSFHSYIPTNYINIPNDVLIYQLGNSLDIHTRIGKFNTSSYLQYFEKELMLDLEVILAQSPLVPLIFEYIRIYFEYPENIDFYKRTIATIQAYNNTMGTEEIELFPIKQSNINGQDIMQELMNIKNTTSPELGWSINNLRNKKKDNKFEEFYLSIPYIHSYSDFLLNLIINPKKDVIFNSTYIDINKNWSKQEMLRGNYVAVRFRSLINRLILFRHILSAVQQSIK